MMPSSRSNPPERLDPPEDVLFVINIYDYLSSELRTGLLAGRMFKLTAYAADSPYPIRPDPTFETRASGVFGRCPQESRCSCDLDGLEMVIEHIRKLGDRHAAKTAIGAQSKFRPIFSRGPQTRLERLHALDHSQVDAGATRPKIFQRREECIVAAIKHRIVDTIHFASGSFDETVGEVNGLA